jgi:hypothetical protein
LAPRRQRLSDVKEPGQPSCGRLAEALRKLVGLSPLRQSRKGKSFASAARKPLLRVGFTA